MNRPVVFGIFTVTMLALLGACSSGGGKTATPIGTHSSKATEIRLIPNQLEAHTGGNVYLTAHVYDGNGQPVKGEQVSFVKISGVGTLSSTTAVTDKEGLCQVTLASNVEGFSLVEAGTTNSTGVYVRDAEFVTFERRDGQAPGGDRIAIGTSITLEIDSDLDGIFNETGDFTIREAGIDATLRARFLDNNDNPIAGAVIEFYSDLYSYQQLVFPDGTTAVTDANGYAWLKVQTSIAVAQEKMSLTIMAFEALTGATNGINLNVVAVGTLSVVSDVSEILLDTETATITAYVFDETGLAAMDGTFVEFTTDLGVLSTDTISGATTLTVPTTDGKAEVTLSSPTTGVATVTGRAGGLSDTATVDVVAAKLTLAVYPASQNILPLSSATFTIVGGDAPYTVFSDQPDLVTVTQPTGDTFVVTNILEPAGGTSTPVTLTVLDALGATATGTLTIGGIAFQIVPGKVTISAGTATRMTVYGAQPPYEIFVSNPECANFCSGGFSPAVGASLTETVLKSGDDFLICTNDDFNCEGESITVTAVDRVGASTAATVELNQPADLAVSASQSQFNNIGTVPWSVVARYKITGGLAPYYVDFSIPDQVVVFNGGTTQLAGNPVGGVAWPTIDDGGVLVSDLPVMVGVAGRNSAEFDVQYNVPVPPAYWDLNMLVYDSNDTLVVTAVRLNSSSATGTTALSIAPTTASIQGSATFANNLAFVADGGTGPYSITIERVSGDDPVQAQVDAYTTNTYSLTGTTAQNVGAGASLPSSITVSPGAVTGNTVIRLIVSDSTAATAQADITITP